MKPATLLSMGVAIGVQAMAGVPDAIAARNLIVQLVMEARDPTDAEWGVLNTATADLHRQVQEA